MVSDGVRKLQADVHSQPTAKALARITWPTCGLRSRRSKALPTEGFLDAAITDKTEALTCAEAMRPHTTVRGERAPSPARPHRGAARKREHDGDNAGARSPSTARRARAAQAFAIHSVRVVRTQPSSARPFRRFQFGNLCHRTPLQCASWL